MKSKFFNTKRALAGGAATLALVAPAFAQFTTLNPNNNTIVYSGLSNGIYFLNSATPAVDLGLVTNSTTGVTMSVLANAVTVNTSTRLAGGVSVANGLTVTGGASIANGATITGTVTATGATSIVGTTNINTSGNASTSIGNSGAAASVTGSTFAATGGTSRLLMDNSGASFSNTANGTPIQVTGVANGSRDFDAVNVRQFAGGVAGAVAAANIPGVDTSKKASLGVGLGSFMSRSALAVGGSYRLSDSAVVRASLATGLNDGGSKASFGIGAGWSW